MEKLKKGIITLYRKVATSLPPDVEEALRAAAASDPKASAELDRLLSHITHSRSEKIPLCIDTGMPVFHVSVPKGLSHAEIERSIVEATREATAIIPLAANAVDLISGLNTGDNTGTGFPIIYLQETDSTKLTIELMLVGAAGESIGGTYSLPDATLKADRSLEGIKACILDAVKKAGGRGCPPYIIGVGVATTRDRAAWLSREQLRRRLSAENPVAELAEFEKVVLKAVNQSGIGPAGKGGQTTALGVRAAIHHCHKESCCVDIYLLCWNTRRGSLIW